MFWSICTDHVKNHCRLATQLSARGMEVKPLNRWSIWIRLLILVLSFCPAQATASIPQSSPLPPLLTTATNGILALLSTVTAASSPVTTPNMTASIETTSTSAHMSTEMTLTTESHNHTTETPSTGNTTSSEATTISIFTGSPTFPETTTISNVTTTALISTSTENTTFPETTTISNVTTTVLISTSTENTTFPETTTISNVTTTVLISTSTENTTFPETTTNFTSFSAAPNPSSSIYTTVATTANQTSMTAVTASKPCDLGPSCSNAFYWMTASVNVTGISQPEINISKELKDFLKSNLDACAVSNNNAGYKSVSGNNTSSVTVIPGLFEDMETTCDSNIKTNSHCNILLKLREPANVCCIRDTVMEMNSANITISVEGQIERVGVCADDITQISAGQFDKCNETIDIDVCTKPQNISCGNSTNVIFPLGFQQNCTVIPSTPGCFCSSHCNSSDFYYYSFKLAYTTNLENIGCQSVYQLLNQSACSNVSSACNSQKPFLSHIRGLRSESLARSSGNCEVIMKLDTQMDLCDIHMAVETIIKSQKNFTFDGGLRKIAICYDPSLDPLSLHPVWNQSLSANFTSELFCTESNRENSFTDFCFENFSTLIPLNGSCNSSTTMYQNVTTTPASFTITSLLNTTTINATVTASVNQTTSSANATTATGILDADGLLSLSANASSLDARQVDQLLSQLESLLAGPNVSLALANTSVNIVNNLLDVPAAVITPFSKRAIGVVDTVGLKLVVSGSSQSVLSQSLSLAVKKVDGANFQETSFSLIDSSNLEIQGGSGVRSSVSEIQPQVRASPLGSVILPSALTQNLTAEQQQLVSRVQFNFFQKNTFFQDKSLEDRKLNSGILGSSVANLSLSGLQKEVLITLRHNGPISANHSALCVFWDFRLNGGSGGWSSSGCRVVNSSAEETQCACNHLTSFGILLDISKTEIPPVHLLILTYITYIGCGISAIFLSVTLLTYLAFGKLRKDIPSKILIHLCFALLLLNLVFLLDAWLALYPDAVGLCISTAFFLHYFLLASFTWMALEAVHMYLAIVQVFNTYISRFMLKIGFIGWGIPLIIVVIVIAVNKDNYGLVTYGRYATGVTDDFCWIKNDVVFYVGVVAYFCLVFLLNTAMFIVVMIQLCRIKQQNPHNTQQRSGWQEVRSVAGLTVLLGLTWGFAFFAWGPVNLAFMYLFAIFNTLQGFFIFVFHCAMKENVRRQWRTYLCCGTLRLAENSEWSRTATQKINKVSQKKPASFHSSNSNNSSSSFLNHDSLAAETPLGIGNPMDDRTITEAEEPSSGSDVVLNELNSQYRGQRSY